jgi:hypothetical protein
MFALQSSFAAGNGASRFIPDFGLVLALSLLARLDAADIPLCALLTAFARSACSIEPNVPLCAGIMAVFALALAARSVVELTGPLWRMLAAGLFVFAFDAWLMVVQRQQLSTHSIHLDLPLARAWPAAVASALLALVAGPLLAHLPGLSPLRRRRW